MAESKTDPAVAETGRVDPRYPAAALPLLKGMRLSPGEAVTLVNISASGVLVEGKTRLVPGTRLTSHFDGGVKPAQIKGRVVRCQVSAIGGGGSLQYQSAIAFEGRVELSVEESILPPAAAHAAPAPEAQPAQKKGKAAPVPAPPPAPPRVYNRW